MRPTAALPTALALTLAAAATLTACGGGSGSDPDTVKVSFKQSTDNSIHVMDDYLADIKKQFEKANPGKKVELVPIKAPDSEYYTKLQQMLRSPKTAPDLVYEDTFLINSDITSGYLKPLDAYLAKWPDWNRFIDTAKAAAKAEDGKTYGVPDGTDTRGLWYDKGVFAKAGLPADWQPKSWDDVLSAARTIKQKVPGVIPMNVYSGKPMGEASAMQGFEMLLYGTKDTLYNNDQQKWVVGSQGFKDSLNFVKTVYTEGIGPSPKEALDPNMGSRVGSELLPGGKLAIALDGSWLYNNWQSTGPKPWPQWSEVLGQTAMPTQDGGGKGKVSLSGGWTWAIPAKSKNPDAAWNLIKTLQTQKNAAKYATEGAQIAVRKDVASDATYKSSSKSTQFFTDLVSVTVYRPAYAEYPKVSNEIITAMEAVMTGQSSIDKAAKNYDEAVEGIVGKDKTTSGQ